MKNRWINVQDEMPKLHYIDPKWSASEPVLATNGTSAFVVIFEDYHGQITLRGVRDGTVATHWQTIELP